MFHARFLNLSYFRSLALAGNKGPCGCSISPSPIGVGRRMERKWQNSWVRIRTVYHNSKWSEQ